MKTGKHLVQVGVISKVLKILEAIQKSPSGLNLKSVSNQTGINRSTAYRFLSHLEREGYLIRDDGLYALGLKLLQLGRTPNCESTLRQLSRRTLRELLASTGETVNLAILDGATVLYIEVLESFHEFRLVSKIGMRRPAHATSLGKVLVAFLPDEEKERVLGLLSFQALTPHTISNMVQFQEELEIVRSRGYAVDNEESVLGARCVGAPILGPQREAVAAISIAGPSTRISQDKIPMFARAVTESAQKVSTSLGYPPPEDSVIAEVREPSRSNSRVTAVENGRQRTTVPRSNH